MRGRPGRCGDSLETNRYAVLRNISLRCVYIHKRFVGPMCRPSTLLPSTPDKWTMCLHDCRSVNDRWLSDSRCPQVT